MGLPFNSHKEFNMEIFERKPDPQKRLDDYANIIVEPFDWKAYNNSQAREKSLFLYLLSDLCKVLEDGTSYCGKGRKPMPSAHMIFCMGVKIYSGVGARRIDFDLKTSRDKGYINSVPACSSVWNYFNSRTITHKLKYLVKLSALPLSQLEEKGSFSIDSSGIAENKYLPRWSHVRQEYKKHRAYKKIHCIVGNKSNVVASVIVTDGNKADSPHFKQLLKDAIENFDIKDICADMGYLARENLDYADDLGITPYIPFKKNSKSHSHGARMWNKMYRYFKDNPEEYAKHYHKRSNVESTFFMIEQRFGKFVYSKNETAQMNEILVKILAHNLTTLIQELFLSNIEIDFFSCAKRFPAQ